MLLELSQEKLIVALAFISTMTFICGWISDRIMGYAGFGVIGNWLLLMAGALVGTYVCGVYGISIRREIVAAMLIPAGAATTMLLLLASVKAATHT